MVEILPKGIIACHLVVYFNFLDAEDMHHGTLQKKNLLLATLLINIHVILYTVANAMFKHAKIVYGVTPADYMAVRYGTICLITLG